MKKIFLLLFLIFLFPSISFGKTIYSTEEGVTWNNPNSWIGNEVPVEEDDVIVTSKIKIPTNLKIRSLTLKSGVFVFYNTNIETNIFKIDTNAILKTYSNHGIQVLNIKSNKVINDGSISYPAKIEINGNFINNGKIISSNYHGKKFPEIIFKGEYIKNNALMDIDFQIRLKPNSIEKKYYILGEELMGIYLDSGNNPKNYYFRGDVSLSSLRNNRQDSIFLNNDRVFKLKKGSFDLIFPNKNKIILGYDNQSYYGIRIKALKSDIFFVSETDFTNIEAKNIFIANNIKLYSANILKKIVAEKIYLGKNSKLYLGSGTWYDKRHVDIEGDIENHGEIYFNNQNTITRNLYNFGKIIQGYNDGKEDYFKLKGDLYNYDIGEINRSFVLLSKSNGNILKNKGKISNVFITEDIEFLPETIFNFPIKIYDKNIILSLDTEFDNKFFGGGINFISKNNNILNLKFKRDLYILKNSNKFNLFFDNYNGIKFKIFENTTFNKIVNLNNSKLNISGKTSNDYYYLKKPIINHGELNFFKKLPNYHRGYTSSYVENHGIITGKIAFGFEDRRGFKYLISENEILTEEEKGELNNSNIVTQTIDLVPKLNEIDKNYFIHYILENKTEIKKEELNKDTESIETNFPDNQNIVLPKPSVIPPTPQLHGDITSPSITLNGNQNVELVVGENYVESGASAIDDIDGDLTNQIQISGSVNINEIGTYQITYQVSDLAGNNTIKTRTVKVISADQTAPILTLNGDSIIELNAGEEYVEFGATAQDGVDGDLTNQIQISGNIDVTHTGNYTISYTVSDLAGNTETITRLVKITNGNSSIGTPQPQPSHHSSGRSGKKVKRSGKNGEKIYSCKDSRALNFSNIGTHKESLCIWKKEGGGEKENKKEEDFAKQNPPQQKEKSLSDEELKRRVEELLKKLEEDKKEKEKEEKILLKSTCLKIQSKEKVLKKNTKDRKNIVKLQYFLKKYKYLNGRVDGAFGNQTKSSLQNFQKDSKLYSDGILGKGTIHFIDRNCGNIKDRSYWEKKREYKRKDEERLEKEKLEKEKKAEGFASQNPPQPNLEEKEKIFSRDILKLKEELKKKEEYWKKEKKNIDNRFSDLQQRAFAGNWASDTLLAPSYALMWTGGKITEGVKSYLNAYSQGWTITKKGLQKLWSGKEEKEFFFKIYTDKDGNKTANKEKHNPKKETILIIHGFQSEPTDWVTEIASSYNNEKREILLLDWKDVVSAPKYSEAVKSVPEVILKLKEILKGWKIDRTKTTIIGHSLGTILSGELSQSLGKFNKLIALDPAIGTGRKDNFFQNKANETICISTWGSDLSNEKFLNYCNQSYLIKSQYLKTPSIGKHSLAHNIYRQILSKNTLYKNIISFNKPTQHTKQNAEVEDERIIKIDGFLNAENFISKTLNYLEMKKDKIDIFLGSSIDNNFSCNNLVCEFAGWYGKDKYKQEILDSNKSLIIIKDFNIYSDDRLFIPKVPKEKNIKYSEEKNTTSFKVDGMRYVLDGVNEQVVKDWLQILNNKLPNNYKQKYTERDLPRLKKENPIQIE